MNDYIQNEYDKLSIKEKELLHSLFKQETDKFSENYKKLSKIVFKAAPPTPEEFLDWRNEWLPKPFAESIFDWVKQDFCEMLNGKKHYSQIVLYGGTRLGKSFLAILLMVYSIVHAHYLRDLSRYYNLAGGTSLSLYILSFNYDKTHQLYLSPFYNLLDQSKRFTQIKFQDKVKSEQEKIGLNTIVWSKAAIVGHATFASKLQLISGNNDALAIIGNNILMGIISEIAFFIENDGATEDNIFRLYSDLVERIKATVGKSYLAMTFLDTSANNAESLIEDYILNTLSKKEDVLFKHRRRWDVPELVDKFYPIYKSTGETFPICVGDGQTPPKILEDFEVEQYTHNLIEHVPIDAKDDFERNLIKSIKDIAGRPTTSESKFIQKGSYIDNVFISELRNIIAGIKADSSEPPERLLFDKVNSQAEFFGMLSGKYIFKRATKEPRYAGVDLSFSAKGDVTGLSIGHKEWSRELNKIMYVCDFTFAVLPGENGINIEACGYFIKDLSQFGGFQFANVLFDTFQSEQLSQFLTRWGIPNEKQSVDTSLNPYLNLYSLLISGQIKSGGNIFLKNNLNSLYRVRINNGKERIDHSKGSLEYIYDGEWTKSKCGFNAKDLSDALANWTYSASQDNFMPMVCYEDENERFNRLNGETSQNLITPVIMKNNYNKLLKAMR